jgi:hypothetical protein
MDAGVGVGVGEKPNGKKNKETKEKANKAAPNERRVPSLHETAKVPT